MKEVETYDEDKNWIEEMIRKKEGDPDIDVVHIVSTPACAVGDNFMSDVKRLEVSMETFKRHSSKKVFLMKRQLANRERREALNSDPAFRNEVAAYNIILPEFERLANEHLHFPECIHASKDCVILSDLCQEGFKMADRMKGLNFFQTSLALKELGKFHGLSLAMKFNDPTRFNNIKSSLHEFIFTPNSSIAYGEMMENALNVAIVGLKAQCRRSEAEMTPLLKKLEALRGSIFQKLFQIVCPREPLTVICHGDFYINNMLFNYNENGMPEDVAFIDLQAARYSSLATDILYFIATSLEKGLLLSHHDTFLEIYHSSLAEQLLRIAPNSQKITLDMIKEEVKSSALFGLIMGFLLLQVVTARPGAIDTNKELGKPTVEETLTFLSPEFFDRLEDLIITFDKIGYL